MNFGIYGFASLPNDNKNEDEASVSLNKRLFSVACSIFSNFFSIQKKLLCWIFFVEVRPNLVYN